MPVPCHNHLNIPPAYHQKTSLQIKVTPYKQTFDIPRIMSLLQNNTENILERLLGTPQKRNQNQYRYGSKKGSLIVTLKGEKRGLWHDFQTGEGGNLLHLIAKEKNFDFKQNFSTVCEEALTLLGASQSYKTSSPSFSTTHENVLAVKSLSQEQSRSLKYARQLARESKPIEGTIAEQYLRQHRGITLEKLPKSFRFHENVYSRINEVIHPALIVIAKGGKGKVKAVQAIFLDEKTGNKAGVKVPKQTWGMMTNASVNINSKTSTEPIHFLAEGPETGLSISEVFPNNQVNITLSKSNFKNIEVKSLGKEVVLCLDNDGPNTHNNKIIHEAAKKIMATGKNVWIARPENINQDYNDVLRVHGRGAVRNNIEAAIPYSVFEKNMTSSITLKSEVLDKLSSISDTTLTKIANFSTDKNSISQMEFKTKDLFPSKISNSALEEISKILTSDSVITKKINNYLNHLNPTFLTLEKTQERSNDNSKIIKKDLSKESEL